MERTAQSACRSSIASMVDARAQRLSRVSTRLRSRVRRCRDRSGAPPPFIAENADITSDATPYPSIVHLIGAVLLQANDEWQLQHRYMQIEAMPELNAPPDDAPELISTAQAA